MRTVKEIEARLDRLFCQAYEVEGDSSEWKTLTKEWFALFEGEYAEALHREGELEKNRPWLQATPRSHIHQRLCRELLEDVLGPVPEHPSLRR